MDSPEIKPYELATLTSDSGQHDTKGNKASSQLKI